MISKKKIISDFEDGLISLDDIVDFVRTDAIEELLKQVQKEEKWLFKVIGSNQNINIAFGGIYAKAEQLKS